MLTWQLTWHDVLRNRYVNGTKEATLSSTGLSCPAIQAPSATFTGAVTAAHFVGGDLSVTNADVSGVLTVNGASGLQGNVNMFGTCTVAGVTTLDSTLNGTDAVFSGNVTAKNIGQTVTGTTSTGQELTQLAIGAAVDAGVGAVSSLLLGGAGTASQIGIAAGDGLLQAAEGALTPAEQGLKDLFNSGNGDTSGQTNQPTNEVGGDEIVNGTITCQNLQASQTVSCAKLKVGVLPGYNAAGIDVTGNVTAANGTFSGSLSAGATSLTGNLGIVTSTNPNLSVGTSSGGVNVGVYTAAGADKAVGDAAVRNQGGKLFLQTGTGTAALGIDSSNNVNVYKQLNATTATCSTATNYLYLNQTTPGTSTSGQGLYVGAGVGDAVARFNNQIGTGTAGGFSFGNYDASGVLQNTAFAIDRYGNTTTAGGGTFAGNVSSLSTLSTGQSRALNCGAALSNNNAAQFVFNNVGGTGSTSNTLTWGIYGGTQATLTQAGALAIGALSATTGAYTGNVTIINPALAAGASNSVSLGSAQITNGCAQFVYNNLGGTGAATNTLTYGIYGGTQVSVDPTGKLTAGSLASTAGISGTTGTFTGQLTGSTYVIPSSLQLKWDSTNGIQIYDLARGREWIYQNANGDFVTGNITCAAISGTSGTFTGAITATQPAGTACAVQLLPWTDGNVYLQAGPTATTGAYPIVIRGCNGTSVYGTFSSTGLATAGLSSSGAVSGTTGTFTGSVNANNYGNSGTYGCNTDTTVAATAWGDPSAWNTHLNLATKSGVGGNSNSVLRIGALNYQSPGSAGIGSGVIQHINIYTGTGPLYLQPAGGATTIGAAGQSNTLTVNGPTTFTGAIQGTSATFSGTISASNISGAVTAGGTIPCGSDSNNTAGLYFSNSGSIQYPVAIQIQDNTYSGNSRAQLNLGSGWKIQQDSAANGTKNFSITTSGNVSALTINPAGTAVTVPALTATTGTFSGAINMQDNPIYIHSNGDTNHGIRFNGTVNGPQIAGFNGGALMTGSNFASNSLTWSPNGVQIPGALAVTGAVTGASYSGGQVSGTTGTFTGAVTGASYTGGPVSGTTGTFSGNISAGSQVIFPGAFNPNQQSLNFNNNGQAITWGNNSVYSQITDNGNLQICSDDIINFRLNGTGGQASQTTDTVRFALTGTSATFSVQGAFPNSYTANFNTFAPTILVGATGSSQTLYGNSGSGFYNNEGSFKSSCRIRLDVDAFLAANSFTQQGDGGNTSVGSNANDDTIQVTIVHNQNSTNVMAFHSFADNSNDNSTAPDIYAGKVTNKQANQCDIQMSCISGAAGQSLQVIQNKGVQWMVVFYFW